MLSHYFVSCVVCCIAADNNIISGYFCNLVCV